MNTESIKKVQLVLFGEYHSKHEDLQEIIIKEFKPRYLLHEALYDFRFESEEEIRKNLEFYENNKDWCEFTMDPTIGFRCYSENEHLYRWALKYGLKLIGCDLHPQKIAEFDDEILEFKTRETRMGKTIKEISDSTDKNIMAIVGDSHLRDNSQIYKYLSKETYIIRPYNTKQLSGKRFIPTQSL